MEGKSFDFARFVEDSKNALLKPKEFFPTLSLEGGLVEPIIKAAIYGAIAGFFYMLWSFLHIGAAVGGLLGGAAGIGALFFGIIGAVIGLFVGGIIILIISSICGGNNNFEANVRVASAIMVVYPISAILTVFSGFSYYMGTLIGLAVNLYTLYMLYIAVTTVLKGNERTAKILSYVLAGLLALFLIIGIGTYMAAKSFVGFSEKKIEKQLKELEKLGKEMESEYEKAAEAIADMEEDEYDATYAKPEKFPSDACVKLNDKFSASDDVLSEELLQKIVKATSEIKEYEKTQTEEILKTIQVNGFESMEEYYASLMSSVYGIQAFGALVAVQAIMDSSDDEKKAAGMFTIDKGMEDLVGQMANAGKLTENDMLTLYDNWDLVVKINKLTQK